MYFFDRKTKGREKEKKDFSALYEQEVFEKKRSFKVKFVQERNGFFGSDKS